MTAVHGEADGTISFAAARAEQAGRLAEAITTVTAATAELAAAGRLAGPGPVFVGIGASQAAACAPVWTLRTRGVDACRLAAGDYPLPFPRGEHPLVGVSQSGRSTETLAVLESVAPDRRYAVVNRTPSPIAATARTVLDIGNIPDSYASTVGYTATVAALGILADVWDGGRADPGWPELAGTLRETERRLSGPVRALAAAFTGARSADFVGSGPSVGSAEAAALLFREVARIPATGMGTRQYLHGSMESAGGGVHVLFGEAREAEVAVTLAAAGHQVILVTTGDAAGDAAGGRNVPVVRLPACPPAQRAILEALAMQILVAAVAEQRSVEIEEFVFHNADTKVPAGTAPE
jgi:glucosamine--fructose-6-phosphate aminotransferase (isomerizing)